jgi:hypothetical protein
MVHHQDGTSGDGLEVVLGHCREVPAEEHGICQQPDEGSGRESPQVAGEAPTLAPGIRREDGSHEQRQHGQGREDTHDSIVPGDAAHEGIGDSLRPVDKGGQLALHEPRRDDPCRLGLVLADEIAELPEVPRSNVTQCAGADKESSNQKDDQGRSG